MDFPVMTIRAWIYSAQYLTKDFTDEGQFNQVVMVKYASFMQDLTDSVGALMSYTKMTAGRMPYFMGLGEKNLNFLNDLPALSGTIINRQIPKRYARLSGKTLTCYDDGERDARKELLGDSKNYLVSLGAYKRIPTLEKLEDDIDVEFRRLMNRLYSFFVLLYGWWLDPSEEQILAACEMYRKKFLITHYNELQSLCLPKTPRTPDVVRDYVGKAKEMLVHTNNPLWQTLYEKNRDVVNDIFDSYNVAYLLFENKKELVNDQKFANLALQNLFVWGYAYKIKDATTQKELEIVFPTDESKTVAAADISGFKLFPAILSAKILSDQRLFDLTVECICKVIPFFGKGGNSSFRWTLLFRFFYEHDLLRSSEVSVRKFSMAMQELILVKEWKFDIDWTKTDVIANNMQRNKNFSSEMSGKLSNEASKHYEQIGKCFDNLLKKL